MSLKRRKNFAIMLIVFCFSAIGATATLQGQTVRGSLSGKVKDATSEEMLQYVNVAILSSKDSSMVSGIITDEKGRFSLKNLKAGKYIVKFSFIGYKDHYSNVNIKQGNTDLGTISLKTASEILKAAEVVAERQMMEYKLDKRVVNVDKNIVSAGGSASDVLENVPSVEVDEEGSVSLRGNSNVKILVDGKPSELLGNDIASVLAQIPASTIENIEVITNPSAKYDPEGMSGIINIKLKEKGNFGLSGNVNISAGSTLDEFMPRANGSASVSYSTKKFGFNASVDGRFNERGRRADNLKILFPTDYDPAGAFMRSQRKGSESGYSEGVKLGFDWYITPKTSLTLSYSGRGHNTPEDKNTIHNVNLLDSMSHRNLAQMTEGTHQGQFHTFSLNFQKKFNKPNQELMIDANWNIGRFDYESTQYIDNLNDTLDNNYLFDKRDASSSRNNRAVVNANYSHPFSENLRMETGYSLNYSKRNSNYDYFFDENTDRDLETSYQFSSEEYINALYATFGYSFGNWSGQAGLRAEQVTSNATKTPFGNTNSSIAESYNQFDKNYFSLYPTLHLSYQITPTQSAQLSYSRRINRPNMHTMMPNVDLSNPEHIRFGNPDIDPEYTNAIELGYSNILKSTTLFASLYYRQTNNRISWFNFLWTEENARQYGFDWVLEVAGDEVDKGKLAMTSLNIDQSRNYGLELIVDQQITKWWKVNLSANFFGSYTDASLVNEREINSFNWDAKLNSTMNLPNSWTIQLSARYAAPSITIQGERAYFFNTDLAVRKAINKKATIALRMTDLFRTMRRKNNTYTEDYIQFQFSRPYRRAVILNFSYRFGGDGMQKPKQRSAPRLDNGAGGEAGENESGE